MKIIYKKKKESTAEGVYIADAIRRGKKELGVGGFLGIKKEGNNHSGEAVGEPLM